MRRSLVIRDLLPHEIPWFSGFAERLFRETYGSTHAAILDPYCAAAFGAGVQERELGEAGAGVLVAEVDGEPAGYAQYRHRQPPAEGAAIPTPTMEVARFYVDHRHHGAGVAQRLMEATLARAAGQGARAVWLQVAEYNDRALRFYEKVGFRPTGRVPFDFGGVRESDHLMAIPLAEARAEPPALAPDA